MAGVRTNSLLMVALLFSVSLIGGRVAGAATVIDVEADLGLTDNVLDDLFTATSSGSYTFTTVTKANDTVFTSASDASNALGAFTNVGGAVHSLVFNLNGGETPPLLNTIGVWVDALAYSGQAIRETSQVEFKVTSFGGSAVSVGTVLKASYIAPGAASTPQAGNTSNRFAYARVTGTFVNVVQIELLFTQATGATTGPRVGEVIALATPVPEPGAMSLLGLVMAPLMMARRRGRRCP